MSATWNSDSVLSGRYHANEIALELNAAYWVNSTGEKSTAIYLLRNVLESFETLSKHIGDVKNLVADYDAEQRISEEDEREQQAAHGQFGVGA